jgi:phage tail-like protein
MAQRVDPLNNYNFKVEIDGIQVGGFSEASGLESTVEVVEYREGGLNNTVHKLPGKTTYSDIVLKRGTTGGDNTLYTATSSRARSSARTARSSSATVPARRSSATTSSTPGR